MKGNARTVYYDLGNDNQGATLLPGSFLDDAGVNDFVWLASGVIGDIVLRTLTANTPEIQVYDFISDTTGRPLIDTNIAFADRSTYKLDLGSNADALFDGLNPATGDAFGANRFEAFSAPAAANGRNAFVEANARLIWSSRGLATSLFQFEKIHAVCPHGMAIIAIGTVITQTDIAVTYTPWSMGAVRRKLATKVGVGGSFNYEGQPVA